MQNHGNGTIAYNLRLEKEGTWFEHDNFSDKDDPDSWDCITPSVCITRASDGGGLYNPLTQYDYWDDWDGGGGPHGTEWAWIWEWDGNREVGSYTNWHDAVFQSGC